jgi:hypothetical protein
MEPLEAWCIISANLSELYMLRRNSSNDAYKGYTDAELLAEVICFEALRQAQKENDQECQE